VLKLRASAGGGLIAKHTSKKKRVFIFLEFLDKN
jgi:hypothetical protein